MRLEKMSTHEDCVSAATLMRLINCLAVDMSIQLFCNQVSNTESVDWSIGNVFFGNAMSTGRSSVTAIDRDGERRRFKWRLNV